MMTFAVREQQGDSARLVVDVLAPQNTQYRALLERYLARIIKSGYEILLENFSARLFDLSRLFGVPVIFERDTLRILGFSSIFRPANWPPGTARVGNRTWVDRNFRMSGPSGPSPVGKSGFKETATAFIRTVFSKNYEICKANDVSLVVITRETKGLAFNALPQIAKSISDDVLEWKIDENGYYQTVPDGDSKDCWQKIIYAEITECSRGLLFKVNRMTCDCYNQKFSNRIASFPEYLAT